MFYEVQKNKKTMPFLHTILFIKGSLQQQKHFSDNINGNKRCCNEGFLFIQV